MRKTVLLLASTAVALLLASGAVAGTAPATGSTFTVNRSGDANDINISDGICDARPASGKQCSLRAALREANRSPGKDLIKFNIEGNGIHTIQPNSCLPTITDPVTIDGYTQPGARPNTKAVGTNAALMIELTGFGAGLCHGLVVMGGDTTIRGLVINGFSRGRAYGVGIALVAKAGNHNNKIEGNFIGTNPKGTALVGNGGPGVQTVNNRYSDPPTTNNTIGGASRASRNIISGNEGGVRFQYSDHTVQNNLIGTDKTATKRWGNNNDSLRMAGVILTATSWDGVTSGNVVSGNTILGHTHSGVAIGGEARGTLVAGNIIAFNSRDGVVIYGYANDIENRLLRNSIFHNRKLGIDLLGTRGPTRNDLGTGDADTGGNGLQNYPVLASAIASASDTITVQGTLDSTPNTTFLVQFFSNPKGNEGETFLGQKRVATDADGVVDFSFSTSPAVAAGHRVTATATGPEGTSEFSSPKTVVAQP